MPAPGKTRPIQVRFRLQDRDKRASLLLRAKNLRKLEEGHRFKKVFVNPDLTAKQREEGKRLRDELRQRRTAGENVRIIRGKAVNVEEAGRGGS